MRYLNMCRNVSNWWEYLFFKFKVRRKEPLVFRCGNDVVAIVPQRLLQTFKEVFFSVCYTKHLPGKTLQHDDLSIVDIGANAGYFSLYMLSKYPRARVIAFEPITKNFDLLEKNRQSNPAKRLVTANRAVGGASGNIILRYDAKDSFSTSASLFNSGAGPDQVEVQCLSLADIFREYGLERIDLLKLDCEGSEYDIIYNCPEPILDSVHAIVLECHEGPGEKQNSRALRRFLESRGYSLGLDNPGIMWAWKERL